MKCKYCESKVAMSLIPIGTGLQVVCRCSCGATWAHDIYSVHNMTQVEGPHTIVGIVSIFEKFLGPLPELSEEPAPEDEAELRYDGQYAHS